MFQAALNGTGIMGMKSTSNLKRPSIDRSAERREQVKLPLRKHYIDEIGIISEVGTRREMTMRLELN